MLILKQLICLLGLMVVLTGCNQKNVVKPPKKQVVKTVKNEEPKQCKNYKKIMNEASEYVSKEFEEGYFIKKDIIGAKAQLFLIQSQSETIFAKNINAAEKSFKQQYQKAIKIKCSVKDFKISPIQKVKNILNKLEKEKK